MTELPAFDSSPDQAGASALVRSADSRQIEECWKAIRKDTIVPLRSDVTARSIPPRLLASMGLCYVRGADHGEQVSYRLAGTRYRQMMGAEITGNHYQEYVEGKNLEERARLVRLVLSIPVGVWWVSEIVFDGEYSCLYCSTLLPLRDAESGGTDHLLDFVECDVPIAMQGKLGIVSRKILRHVWIDVGSGTPN